METAGHRFALALRHHPAEPAWCDAWLCDTPDAVRAALTAHNPAWTLPATPGPVPNEVVSRFQGAWAGLLAALIGRPA